MKTITRLAAICGTAFFLVHGVEAAGRQTLRNHVPPAVANARRNGPLSREQRLHLSIGLPLRNTEELDRFIAELSDPASPNYRAWLTPEQFTERFGPTEADYQKVIDFAGAGNLRITGTHANRMIVDVSGSVPAIEAAFSVNLSAYTDSKRGGFFAPDREPVIQADLPILDVNGLDNYTLPKPMDVKATPLATTAFVGSGSGPSGLLLGRDFRAAYAPGVTLTGSGQSIGIFELDGFYANDIPANFKAAGLPVVPVETVLVDGVSGAPGGANIEVMLDIMMAAYMAPGAKIIVYEGDDWNDVLNQMATENRASQLSSSWGFSPINATTEQIFRQMIAQGQSLFQASGDSGAYTGWITPPSDNPNVTVVGGTGLTTSGPGGAWLSETVWPGSGGGVSTTYSIPSYQQGMNMAALGGSATMRNIPDVALTAAVQMYLIQNNGQPVSVGGTSAAAPLWAGFMALVNQQAKTAGKKPIGFLNPAMYSLGSGATYQSAMHDIVIGNNNGFTARPGFDLTTGWGTPSGQRLIDLLTASPSTPSFLLSTSSTVLLAAPGSSVSAPIATIPQNGFTGAVSLTASGLPAGVTAAFSASGVLTLTLANSAAPGTSSFTVTGTSGSLVKTLPLNLTIGPVPSFTLSASPAALTIAQGSSAASIIGLTAQNSFTGQVTVSLSALPAGVTGAITANGTLTLNASTSAAPGTFTLTVTGVSGSLTKTVSLAVTVAAVPAYTLSATPATLNILQGASGVSTIAVTPANGFKASVALAASGLPSGVSAAFSSTGVLTLSVARTAPAGTSNITITGTSGTLSRTTAISLTVAGAPGFTLTATPVTLGVVQGGTATGAIKITPQNGFSGAVALSASGLPSGITASFAANGALTVNAAAGAPVGIAVMTVTGTSGAISVRTSVNVSVVGAPDFSLFAPTPAITVVKGFKGTAAIVVAPLRGFSGAITLKTSGLPVGVTASLSALGAAGQNAVTFSTTSAAAAGTASITLTGTSGTLVRTAKIDLTIVAAPATAVPVDFSAVYNVTGIAADAVPFTTGGLDAHGHSYSGYLLAGTQTIAGVPFVMGPMNAPDAVTGKTIPLPAMRASAIKLLGTGLNGNQAGQTFTVNYTDGTKTTFTQSLSDWSTPQLYPGETKAVTSAYRNNNTGTTDARPFLLYQYTFSLNTAKTVSSIVLPANPNVVVMSAAMVP